MALIYRRMSLRGCVHLFVSECVDKKNAWLSETTTARCPIFWGGRGGRRGSAMAPLERAMVVSYRLSIVTVALSVTIRLQFAIECLRCSNQQAMGHFGPKFPGVPLE